MLDIHILFIFFADINARETGSNKQAASKSCALSLVRQLYHLNIIEPFSGTLKKTAVESIKPYEVELGPELEAQLDSVLRNSNLPVAPLSVSCLLLNYFSY